MAIGISTFILDPIMRFVGFLREAVEWAFGFIPRLTSHLQPARKILMSATALNGRQVGGIKVRGFLGRPTVMSLTG